MNEDLTKKVMEKFAKTSISLYMLDKKIPLVLKSLVCYPICQVSKYLESYDSDCDEFLNQILIDRLTLRCIDR